MAPVAPANIDRVSPPHVTYNFLVSTWQSQPERCVAYFKDVVLKTECVNPEQYMAFDMFLKGRAPADCMPFAQPIYDGLLKYDIAEWKNGNDDEGESAEFDMGICFLATIAGSSPSNRAALAENTDLVSYLHLDCDRFSIMLAIMAPTPDNIARLHKYLCKDPEKDSFHDLRTPDGAYTHFSSLNVALTDPLIKEGIADKMPKWSYQFLNFITSCEEVFTSAWVHREVVRFVALTHTKLAFDKDCFNLETFSLFVCGNANLMTRTGALEDVQAACAAVDWAKAPAGYEAPPQLGTWMLSH